MKNKEIFLKEIKDTLFSMQDVKYRDFHAKLMPTIDKETIIGVRTPALRKYAKELMKTDLLQETMGNGSNAVCPNLLPNEAVEIKAGLEVFLQDLPHEYYEENNLHGFIIEAMKDYDQCLAAINAFLPYVDNWATCDMMGPKVFKKHLSELRAQIQMWLDSGEDYTIRFGVNMLMKYYLDEAFEPEYLDWVASIQSEEYYVKMVVAWYFATALAKQYEATIGIVEQKRLEKWTHNKTIQKAVESYRITDEQKCYLKTLKMK